MVSDKYKIPVPVESKLDDKSGPRSTFWPNIFLGRSFTFKIPFE